MFINYSKMPWKIPKLTPMAWFATAPDLKKNIQGNNRFWNPNPLGLGGKTALVNETKPLKKD